MEKNILEKDLQLSNEEEVKDIEVNEEEQEQEQTADLLTIISENEEIKKQFERERDRAISKALATRDKKHQDELRKQGQRAKMTESELQAEKERELQEREVKLQQAELKLAKVDYFKENDIPLDLIDVIHVDNADELEEKVNVFKQVYQEQIQKEVQNAIKSNGINIGGANEIESFSLDDLGGMTAEEINANWDKIVE